MRPGRAGSRPCGEELVDDAGVIRRTVGGKDLGEHIGQLPVRRDPEVRQHDVQVLLVARVDGTSAGGFELDVCSFPAAHVLDVSLHLFEWWQLEFAPPERSEPKGADLRRRTCMNPWLNPAKPRRGMLGCRTCR